MNSSGICLREGKTPVPGLEARILPAIGDTGNAPVGKSDKLILLCGSLTINRVGGFLRNSSKISLSLKKRAAQIKVLLMDVDGTMTDGGVTFLSQTEDVALEIKTFDAHDGQGLTLAHIAGLRTGCITGRQSSALPSRIRDDLTGSATTSWT